LAGSIQFGWLPAKFHLRESMEMKPPYHPRYQILVSMFFGALIAAGLMAILIIRSPHAHATPDSDAQETCEIINAGQSMHAIDAAVYTLIGKGYGIADQQLTHEIMYAVLEYCPQDLPLINQWVHSPTIGGTTPEGGLA
jgi:hypothetical protein